MMSCCVWQRRRGLLLMVKAADKTQPTIKRASCRLAPVPINKVFAISFTCICLMLLLFCSHYVGQRLNWRARVVVSLLCLSINNKVFAISFTCICLMLLFCSHYIRRPTFELASASCRLLCLSIRYYLYLLDAFAFLLSLRRPTFELESASCRLAPVPINKVFAS